MATGRTVEKWTRVYQDGYDISGMARKVGECGITYDEHELTALSDSTKGYLPGNFDSNVSQIDAIFDNTATTGLHTVAITAGAKRTLLIAYGQLATPAQGDACYGGQFTQGAYQAVREGGVFVNLPYMGWAADASVSAYARPFGTLLHASGAETAVNTAVGVDDNGAATSQGGYMVYQVLTSSNAAHTATIKVQDAATNADGSFADLTGCTTGVITVTAGVSGMVAATTTTVRRYLRWQIVLGTATSVTFLIGFFRA
jgi:hypothetical protein